MIRASFLTGMQAHPETCGGIWHAGIQDAGQGHRGAAARARRRDQQSSWPPPSTAGSSVSWRSARTVSRGCRNRLRRLFFSPRKSQWKRMSMVRVGWSIVLVSNKIKYNNGGNVIEQITMIL
jgi:hypothetical protein